MHKHARRLILAMMTILLATAPAARAEPPAAADDASDAQAVPDAPAAEQPADAEDAEDAAEAPRVEIEVRPYSVNFNRSVRFDEEGKVRNENNYMSIGLRCRYDTDGAVLGYRLKSLDPIRTRDGRTLKPQTNDRMRDVNRRGDREPEFNLSLSIQDPPAVVGALQRIAGRVELRVGMSPIKKAVLGPMSKVDGKRAKIMGIEGAWAQVTRREDRTRVEYSEAIKDDIQEIRLLDDQGREMPKHGWNGSSTYREFRDVELPDGGRVEILLYDQIREVTVPFEVRNIPMPQSGQRGFDLAVNLQPLGGGEAGDDGAAELGVQIGQKRERAEKMTEGQDQADAEAAQAALQAQMQAQDRAQRAAAAAEAAAQ